MRSLIDRERCAEPTIGCYTFHWQATEWSECLTRQESPQCGRDVGIQQRDIYCAESSGHRVPVKRYSFTRLTPISTSIRVAEKFIVDGRSLFYAVHCLSLPNQVLELGVGVENRQTPVRVTSESRTMYRVTQKTGLFFESL